MDQCGLYLGQAVFPPDSLCTLHCSAALINGLGRAALPSDGKSSLSSEAEKLWPDSWSCFLSACVTVSSCEMNETVQTVWLDTVSKVLSTEFLSTLSL